MTIKAVDGGEVPEEAMLHFKLQVSPHNLHFRGVVRYII